MTDTGDRDDRFLTYFLDEQGEPVGIDMLNTDMVRGLIHGCDCGCRGDWHLPNYADKKCSC